MTRASRDIAFARVVNDFFALLLAAVVLADYRPMARVFELLRLVRSAAGSPA